ncbi:MAG: glycosyltransferase, partial [Nostoc sp.]
MHITIVTLGTAGDIRPYVPLALGLEKSGHKVRIAALAYDDTAEEFVRSFGIEFVPMDWELVDIGEYFLKKRIFNIRTLNEIAWISEELKNKNGMLTHLWQVCQGTDAIMFNTTVFPC